MNIYEGELTSDNSQINILNMNPSYDLNENIKARKKRDKSKK